MLFVFSSDEADFTDTVPVGNGLGEIQLAAEAFCNAAVTAHCIITKLADFFITAALLLPCLYQWTVVEINVQIVISTLFDIHFKY